MITQIAKEITNFPSKTTVDHKKSRPRSLKRIFGLGQSVIYLECQAHEKAVSVCTLHFIRLIYPCNQTSRKE